MITLVLFTLVILGLSLGSFVNALVWRLREQEERAEAAAAKKASKAKTARADSKKLEERDLSIVHGRSMCTWCGHALAARDLVPVVSYVWLRGTCRYCGKPIQDTPIAELAVPILFLISYAWWPMALEGIGLAMFACWLIFVTAFVALTIYDIRWFLLPDRIVYPLLALAGLEVVVRMVMGDGWSALVMAGWGVVCVAGLFYILFVLSRGTWIGFGDVKLGVVLGLLVGGPLNALLLVFIASLLGSLAAVPMLVRGEAKASSHVPFGPFLLAATMIVVLLGGHITSWYMGLFYLS